MRCAISLLTPDLAGLLSGLLDALGKGYSAVELIWKTESTPWIPTYTWRDPRFFRYDRETGSVLRLLDASNAYDGIELPPYRFIVHTPRLKMGLPIRGGLARLCATGHVCALYALEDWLAFAEVFGMPLRLGRYNSSATEDDKAKLKAAVSGLGADAAAVLHESMQIEFQAAAPGAGGADLYERLLDNLHKLVSKAVLGRSDAADATSGKLGNEQTSSEVRRDILESDAEELSQTLNAHLVRPFIDLNFGPQERYPTLKLYVPDQEDLAALVDMLAKLVPLGLKVEQSVIRDKFGLPDPDPKGELLGTPNAPLPAPTSSADGGQGSAQSVNRALNRQALLPAPDAIDTLAAEALADWEPLMQPVINPIQTLAEAADSFEAFPGRIAGAVESNGQR
jgi:phage gp29-like protein